MQTIRQNLSRYRNALKGVAILWVVFFHAQLGLSGLLYDVQRIGYGGVDIFFFLSGFGLYYSLERDADLGRYLKRRGERLLPAYLPFCLLWLAVMLTLSGNGLATSVRIAMSNLTMLGFLSGSPLYINWYTGALLLSLVLAPFFYAVLKPGKHYWLRAAALFAVLFAAGLGYIDNTHYQAICRLPLMALGMICAGCTIEQKKMPLLIAALFAAGALGMTVLFLCLNHYQELLTTYAMYWHPFVLIVPALCVGLGWLFGHVPAAVTKPLGYLGQASFEIFLFNAWFEVLGKRYGLFHSPMEWIVWSVLSIVFGCLYHAAIGSVTRKWKSRVFSD